MVNLIAIYCCVNGRNDIVDNPVLDGLDMVTGNADLQPDDVAAFFVAHEWTHAPRGEVEVHG